MIIGLRHDIDDTYGIRRGLPKVIGLERRYGVKSTIFVRIDVLRSKWDCEFLRKISREGWEIGLHLANTIGDESLMPPREELRILREIIGVDIYGVTPCGKTIGF